IRVFNSGPGDATGVSLQSSWSTPLSVNSMSSAAGACSLVQGTVVCDLGTLAGGAEAAILITISTSTPGFLTNVCALSRRGLAGSLENNSFRTVTEVVSPVSIAIDD